MDSEKALINYDKESVRKALMYNYDFFEKNDLSDEQTFDSFKTLYSDTFVFVPGEGKLLLYKDAILEDWRALFKENKGEFKLTIDRIEVSGDLAYVLYYYDEKLTNIKSGDVYFKVTQSAIAILKKDSHGKWKFEALKWS